MRRFLLVLGDVLALYLSLGITLFFRYGKEWLTLLPGHILPFSLVFLIWLMVFYIAGLYDFRRLRNRLDFFQVLMVSLGINALLATLFFYLTRSSGITPKTNLIIYLAVFFVLETIWRQRFNRLSLSLRPVSRVVLLGGNQANEEIYVFLKDNPQLGYAVKGWVETRGELPLQIRSWEELVRNHSADLLVVPRGMLHNAKVKKLFYDLVDAGIEIKDLPTFYESVFRKVPFSEIDEEWFLEYISGTHDVYESVKRIMDIVLISVAQLIALPLEILIALAIKISSPGPVIYKQMRVGRHGREFLLYKFRRMHHDKERNPDADSGRPVWSPPGGDSRETAVGRFLRATHLDELPQLLNILKGDLALVGPRPERPELVGKLKQEISHYEMRHLIKPGLTGWAQVHQAKDTDIADVKEKLSYDLYYLKNRSFVLDFAILLKTIKAVFVSPNK